MGDRGPVGGLRGRAGRVDMNPLMVVRGIGEPFDSLLGDLQPLAHGEFVTEPFTEGRKIDDHGHSVPPRAATIPKLEGPEQGTGHDFPEPPPHQEWENKRPMAERLVTIGADQYRLEAAERDGQWVAVAYRLDDGRQFGPPVWGATADAALDRIATWLAWQREHQEALAALQEAERAYQRLVAGRLVAGPDDPSLGELEAEALERLEQARARLDEIRERRPA